MNYLVHAGQTGLLQEGPFEVVLRRGQVVGTFYEGFPAPPLEVAAALLLPHEGGYSFSQEETSETSLARPLSVPAFLLGGAEVLGKADLLLSQYPPLPSRPCLETFAFGTSPAFGQPFGPPPRV
ncbi:MAG: hypothetical protein ACUVUP_02735 [Thermaceae bacterium]